MNRRGNNDNYSLSMDKKLPERDDSRVPHRQFDAALSTFRDLEPKAAAGLALAAADIALVVDADGVIADVAFHDASFGDEGVGSWIGRPWSETVTVESRSKIDALMSEARAGQFARKREVNHLRASVDDLPIRYTAVPLGKRGDVLAVGMDLRPVAEQQQQLINAQQMMEREYAKLRQAEARYRLLFRLASEAVLVVDAARETVVDANPTCVDMLGRPINQIADHKLATLFDKSAWTELSDLLATVRSGANAGEVTLKLLDGKAVRVAASLFRQEGISQMLIRLAPKVDVEGRGSGGKSSGNIIAAVEALPDAFVVTDEDGMILSANPAFCDLAGVVSLSQLEGRKLESWLGRTSVDVGLILTNVREHGSVRNFATVVRDDIGAEERVVLSAAASPEAGAPCIGFLLRRSASASVTGTGVVSPMMRSANQLTELVGRVPMKELVRETTDMIEKMCMEAALELTGNNRASAADLLGLSRQSFYIKLRRHGLLDGDNDDTA
ncbi:MAG: transcriptional regulator PpsR [Anderseniella sp.]|jgi:transcriptional regulator PpsR|nr:transcriptional regulator PpsR [Anderseniella sp.]